MKEIIKNANQGVAPSVRGIEVACCFFWEVGLPVLEAEFAPYIDRLAAGLVGAGSDCSGNDDEVSLDYDWGPRFQIFLSQTDFDACGSTLQGVLDKLPKEFRGLSCQPSSDRSNHVFSIDGFFRSITSNGVGQGFTRAPETPIDWLKIPESRLFDVTHGQVFYDPLGDFTERRRGFAAYYPHDAWRKRLAAALIDCGNLGPKLLSRSMLRGDYYTAQVAWWSFVEATMRLGFLLSRQYAPWRKWLYREFCKLPEFSVEVTELLWNGQCDITCRPELVDRIIAIYDNKLRELGLVSLSPQSFIDRAEEITAGITDTEVAGLAPWVHTLTTG